MDNAKRPKSDEKGTLQHHQQSKAAKAEVVDENKVTTGGHNGNQVVAKDSKSRESRTTSESKVNVRGSLNANAFRQPNILTSRNDQRKYVAIDHSKALHRGKSDASKVFISKSNEKSDSFHHAMSNKKLVSKASITAKTSKGRFNNALHKDALEGSDKLQTSMNSKKASDQMTTIRKNSSPSVQQRIKRQQRLRNKKNKSHNLNIQHSVKYFLSSYNALFMRKHLKVGHNSCKRISHRPEVSYIYQDKMCWFKPRRFQKPRRLLKYRYAAKLTEDINPLSTDDFNPSLLPEVNLECHIFGFPKSMQRFNGCFKKLCEIIVVEDMKIQNVRQENGAKVIELADSYQRNHFLAAYENYKQLVKTGTVLPLTSKLCGGVTNKNICVRADPKNLKKRGHRVEPVENGIGRRGYGTLINASNILCHAF